ncbi:MAG: transposase, partial [Blastocatellia bacterium]
IEHIDGVPFRKLGDENDLGGAQSYNRVSDELARIPGNTFLTGSICDPSRFSHILVMDGKYVAVKGFAQKIPFLYGIDYLTHDIPYGGLFVAEDEMSFSQFFSSLKQIGYGPRIVVADDRRGLKRALHKVFPHARLQLCHNHYLENIRRLLMVRTETRYQHFFNSLRLHVFLEGTSEQKITQGLRHVFHERCEGKRLLQNIVTTIEARREDLFACLKVKDAPNNTNLIELYNSHLNGRLKTIKGFQSFDSARSWLNAYLVRRRTKPLTDCKEKFRYLNGHASLELTIKKQALWPEQLTKLGIPKPKFFEKNDKKALKT